MGIPLVALMGKTPQELGELPPVELQEKRQAIKSSQQQQQQSAALFPGQMQQQGIQTQLGQQAVQSGALDLALRQAANDAWKAAATTAPDGTIQLDPNKLQTALATSGHGEAIPAISKGLMDMQKSANELSTQKSTLAAAEADAAGAGAQTVIAGQAESRGSITYDPNVKAVFQHMANAGYGQQAQQLSSMGSNSANGNAAMAISDCGIAEAAATRNRNADGRSEISRGADGRAEGKV